MQEVVWQILFFCSLYTCTIVPNTEKCSADLWIRWLCLWFHSTLANRPTQCHKKFVPSFMLLLQLNGSRLTQAKNCDNPLISLVLMGNTELESLLLVKNFRVVCCWLYPSRRRTGNMPLLAQAIIITKRSSQIGCQLSMSPGTALFQILGIISSKNSELPA